MRRDWPRRGAVPARLVRAWAAIGAAAAIGACTPAPRLPDLDTIYDQVADGEGTERRPLITIPGTLGSRLVDGDTGTVIWGGGSRGLSADPEDPVEAALIALPILAPDQPISELRDSVGPVGILDTARAEVLGIPIDVEVYGGVLRTLTAGGFRTEERNSQFGQAGPDDDSDDNPAAFRRPDPPAGTLPDAPPGAPAAALAVQASAAGPGPAHYAEIAADQSSAFRFAYDWRRDLPSLAKDFHRFVLARKRKVAALRALRSGQSVAPESVRFDLLAHSMGGLLARYYLMYGPQDLGEAGPLPPITWEGAEHFDRVIIVAAPNAGSVLAMDNLVNGKSLGPLQPVYPAALLATHGSPWQLFPRARHRRVRMGSPDGPPVDPLDPALWERMGWGLASAEAGQLLEWIMPEVADPAERRARALAHQARLMARARRFQEAMDREWVPAKPAHLEMFLVAGGGFATPAGAVVDEAERAFRLEGEAEGDGVVLRESVLLDERQGAGVGGGLRTPLRFDTTLFLPDEHVELTKNPVFGDNLLFWLLEQPRSQEALAEPREASLLRGDAPQATPAPTAGAPGGAPGSDSRFARDDL